MQIEILEFIEGARKARGLTVIIDVFRAFSVACYAFDAGAARVITTATVEDALSLAGKYKNSVLAGERHEKRLEGFHFGNSPTEIIKSNLSGKTFIHTTTAGTQGLTNAVNADIILTGSIVNAGAVSSYIRSINPVHVSLVAMGYRANMSADEDLLCARMISDGILGKNTDYSKEIHDLRNSSGQRFFESANMDFSPPTDFFLCTMPDRFSFILKAVALTDGGIELFRIDF